MPCFPTNGWNTHSGQVISEKFTASSNAWTEEVVASSNAWTEEVVTGPGIVKSALVYEKIL